MASSASPARLAANRANARRSTGPRTPTGKAVSSRNATTHGLLSRQPLLADEDPAEHDDLRERLLDALSPDDAIEELLVDDLLGVLWRLRRLRRVESALFAVGSSGPLVEALRRSGEHGAEVGVAFTTQASSFNVLSRYEASLVARLRRTLADLELRQAWRVANETRLVVIDGEG